MAKKVGTLAANVPIETKEAFSAAAAEAGESVNARLGRLIRRDLYPPDDQTPKEAKEFEIPDAFREVVEDQFRELMSINSDISRHGKDYISHLATGLFDAILEKALR